MICSDSQIVFELFLVGVSLRFFKHSLWFALSTVPANQSEGLEVKRERPLWGLWCERLT